MAENNVNPNITRKVREGCWSIVEWKPREGKRPKFSLEYSFAAPGRDWNNQRIWFTIRNLPDLKKAMDSWEDEAKVQ